MASPSLHEVLTNTDLERQASAKAQLENTSIDSFAWHDVTVTVKDRSTKQPKAILQKVDGLVRAGKRIAYLSHDDSTYADDR